MAPLKGSASLFTSPLSGLNQSCGQLLEGGKKRRKKLYKEGKLTGLTIGVIDSGWRSGCDIRLHWGDAGAPWGNPAKPFFPEPGADGLGEGWPYELNNSNIVGT